MKISVDFTAQNLYEDCLDMMALQTSGLIQGEMASDDLDRALEEAEEQLHKLSPTLYAHYCYVSVQYLLNRIPK